MAGLNMDFTVPLRVALDTVPWTASPGGEVERRKLEREAAESGWTTSVVRYPPKSRFPSHTHVGGEEFLVLEGTFSDLTGNFGPGSYLRNPIGSSHAPFSEEGCVIFVKLGQMTKAQENRVVLPEEAMIWRPRGRGEAATLYVDAQERVGMIRGGGDIALDGAEALVLRGSVAANGEATVGLTWFRAPAGTPTVLELGTDAVVWYKQRAS